MNITDMYNGTMICSCEVYNETYTAAYKWTNLILIILILPLVATFGFAFNVINFIIFKRLSSFSVMNVYLACLALTDACVCIGGIVVLSMDSLKNYTDLLSHAFVEAQVLLLPVAFMVQTCSVYITVAATINGFIEVYFVSRKTRQRWLSYRRAFSILLSVALFSVLYNIIRFAEFRAERCWHAVRRQLRREICPTPLYVVIRDAYDVLLYTVVMTIVPFVVILFLSALIIRRTHLHERLKHIFYFPSLRSHVSTIIAASGLPIAGKMVDPDQVQVSLRDERIITLIMLVCLFVLCNVMAVIATVVLSVITESQTLLINVVSLHYITDFSNFLVVLNSSANFIIYAGCNSQFRRELRRLFGLPPSKKESAISSLAKAAYNSISPYADCTTESEGTADGSINAVGKSRRNTIVITAATKLLTTPGSTKPPSQDDFNSLGDLDGFVVNSAAAESVTMENEDTSDDDEISELDKTEPLRMRTIVTLNGSVYRAFETWV